MGLTLRDIGKLIAPLRRRVSLIAGRGVLRLIDDAAKEQLVQVDLLNGETATAERYQHYGFTSHPHPDGEAIVLALGGNREHCIVIADGDRRYRLKGLAQGEVALYDDQGQAIHLKRDKQIHVSGCDKLTADVGVSTTVTCPLVTVKASTKVVLDTPLVEATKEIRAMGNITDNYGSGGVSMAGMREIYNNHDHDENDNSSTTDQPNQAME